MRALAGDSTMTRRLPPWGALPFRRCRRWPRRSCARRYGPSRCRRPNLSLLPLSHLHIPRAVRLPRPPRRLPQPARRRPNVRPSATRSLYAATRRVDTCVPATCPMRFLKPIEPPRRWRTMMEMAEYSYMVLYLPRDIPRDDRGGSSRTMPSTYRELARMLRNADGSRKATLRRQIIRPARTPLPRFRP